MLSVWDKIPLVINTVLICTELPPRISVSKPSPIIETLLKLILDCIFEIP